MNDIERTKNLIALTLMDTLSYAYCDSCKYMESEEGCDGCHRKSQNWALGKITANYLADKIVRLINSEEK